LEPNYADQVKQTNVVMGLVMRLIFKIMVESTTINQYTNRDTEERQQSSTGTAH